MSFFRICECQHGKSRHKMRRGKVAECTACKCPKFVHSATESGDADSPLLMMEAVFSIMYRTLKAITPSSHDKPSVDNAIQMADELVQKFKVGADSYRRRIEKEEGVSV